MVKMEPNLHMKKITTKLIFELMACIIILILIGFSGYIIQDTNKIVKTMPNITLKYINYTTNLSCPKPMLSCPEPKVVINCPKTECEYVTNEFTSHFQKVISSVYIEREYDYNDISWNCDEMSDELKDRLRNADYNCITKVGFYNNGTDRIKHQWIICKDLIVEATNGEIVHPDEYWRYDGLG